MGQRREPRKDLKIPVRVFGTDIHGKPFSENLTTHNVSSRGARVGSLQASVKVGEVVGMTYGAQKSRFTVRWIEHGGAGHSGQLGLENLTPEKPFWDFPLPAPGIDEYGRHSKGTERRNHPRLKCMNSVELYPEGESAKIWGKAVDLSMGGCFVEMPMPLKEGTKLKIILWIKDQKLLIKGKVMSSRPGFGIGVHFNDVSPEDAQCLRQFLQSITRLPI